MFSGCSRSRAQLSNTSKPDDNQLKAPRHNHSFAECSISIPTFCDHCGLLLCGICQRQGLQCYECNYVCHVACEPFLTKLCRETHPDKPLDHEFTELPLLLTLPTFCNVCRRMVISLLDSPGYICKVCQYITHNECVCRAERNCVALSDVDSESMAHKWVEGNILGGKCAHCQETMTFGGGMTGFRCYWCHGVVHNKCKALMKSTCDMGELALLKVPPTAISSANQLEGGYKLRPERFSVMAWPLLVFINKRSGGQQGERAKEALLRLINPLQIFELSDGGPDVGMDTFLPLVKAGIRFVILVCGGDGTVSWVLDVVQSKGLAENEIPPVGILPLGTGNDLARTLGWGEGYEGEDLAPFLLSLFSAIPVHLDRWQITHEDSLGIPKNRSQLHLSALQSPTLCEVETGAQDGIPIARGADSDETGEKGFFPSSPECRDYRCRAKWETRSPQSDLLKLSLNNLPSSEWRYEREETCCEAIDDLEQNMASTAQSRRDAEGKLFNNYFSIGIDAKIAKQFHAARQAHPGSFSSRKLNKLHYLIYGTSQMLRDPPMALHECIRLEIDGTAITLPALEGLVFLNIPSYAGGADLWGESKKPFQGAAIGDSLIEVAGIASSLHLGQITTHTATAVQLGQGSHIRLTLSRAMPCQVDGEPWVQNPATIHIRRAAGAKVLVRKISTERGSFARALDPSFVVLTNEWHA